MKYSGVGCRKGVAKGGAIFFLVAIAMAEFASPPASSADTQAKPQNSTPAPAPPRLADGHPNFTGFWVPADGMLEHSIGLGGFVPSSRQPPPPLPDPTALKAPYDSRLAEARKSAKGAPDPVANCYPPGMPQMMVMVYGMELLQTPGQVAMTSEWQAESRRIWLDQKSHTPSEELDPTYSGESIGHWEGNSLIVDTVGIRTDVVLNFPGQRQNNVGTAGIPHSEKLHLVETFTERKPGILEDKIVIDDPEVFVSPWVITHTYRYRPDLRIKEYECLENNRNVGSDGSAVFK